MLVNYLLPRDVVRLCAKHRVTGLTCVPPLWIQLAEQDWPAEATQQPALLRQHRRADAAAPRSTSCARSSPAPPFLMYGLTEAFRSTYLDPAEVDRRPDSIGKAIPNAEILVVRPDGTLCEPGEEGELVHRGALVALGYWNDPERTAERFQPAPGPRGRHHARTELAVWSGDLVMRDEDGFLYFVGRNDEMIKTSGYRVSPTEIEEAAYDTGLVRDAVALGVDDPRLGQRIVLVVSPAERRSSTRPRCSPSCASSCRSTWCPSDVIVRCRAAALAQRQVRPQPAAPGAAPHERRDRHRRRRPRRLRLRSAASRSTGSPSASAARRSSPTTGGCSPSGSSCCARRCPPGIDLSYAVKANPMPAVVQHLAGLVDSLDVASAARDARRARHADAGRAASASPGPGKTPAELTPGGRRRRDDRDGVRDRGRARRRRSASGSASGRASRCASTPTSRSRARACGWAAARSSSASTPRRCRRCSSELAATDLDFLGFHIFAGSQNLQRRDPLRGPAQDRRAGAARSPTTRRSRSATSTSAAASASRTSRRTSRSTCAAIGENLERAAGRRDPPEPARGPGRDRARPLHRRRVRRLRDPRRRPQGVARQDLPRRRRRACTTSSPRRATSAR